MVPADDAFGRLILALLCCSDAHPHAEYYRQLFSLDEATSSLMALWEDGSEEAKRAAGSLSFERSRRSRREMLREYAALADTGELPSLSLRQYLHGKLALQTRAFAVEDGRALIPVRRPRRSCACEYPSVAIREGAGSSRNAVSRLTRPRSRARVLSGVTQRPLSERFEPHQNIT